MKTLRKVTNRIESRKNVNKNDGYRFNGVFLEKVENTQKQHNKTADLHFYKEGRNNEL